MTNRARITIVASLVLVPLVLFLVAGGYALWNEGMLRYLVWFPTVGWILAFWLASRWFRQYTRRWSVADVPLAWTKRDEAAWEHVQKRLRDHPIPEPDELEDPAYYERLVKEMAIETAQHYHPKAVEWFDGVTVLELVAFARLVSEDMEELIQKYIPGGHVFTVGQLKRALEKGKKAADWAPVLNEVAWWGGMAATAIMTGGVSAALPSLARYTLGKQAYGAMMPKLQDAGVGIAYRYFVERTGFYLIELNSGKLRGGAVRYRQLQRELAAAAPAAGTSAPPVKPAAIPAPAVASDAPLASVTVTIAVVGQVKAGKSSLINALLGEQRAAVDVVPLTSEATEYLLPLPDGTHQVRLVDTPGYSDSGATRKQMEAMREAARRADLILLVMDAVSPAKQADHETLSQLEDWLKAQPHFKPTPVLLVLNKVDLLKPALEWSPPYNVASKSPKPKEKSIREACAYLQEIFGSRAAGVIPVMTGTKDRAMWGVQDVLLPAILTQLPAAQSSSIVRAFYREQDEQKVWKIVDQLLHSGQAALPVLIKQAGPLLTEIAGPILVNRIPNPLLRTAAAIGLEILHPGVTPAGAEPRRDGA